MKTSPFYTIFTTDFRFRPKEETEIRLLGKESDVEVPCTGGTELMGRAAGL